MPRRAAAGRRPIEADAVHNSKLVQQVVNKVMVDKNGGPGVVPYLPLPELRPGQPATPLPPRTTTVQPAPGGTR